MTDDLTIDLDAIRERLDSVAQIAQLTGERDRARDMAVALEAELARLVHERDRLRAEVGA